MNISAPFILRPVATALIMIAIMVLGSVAYILLPIAALPQVDVPTISINVQYPGASPDVVASSIAQPLERQFAVLPDVQSITSQNGLGISQITVQFSLDRDADGAAADVQAAISAANGFLPADLPSPPTYKKVNPADQPVIILGLTSDTLPLTTVDEYADTDIAQRISLIHGVGQVLIYGQQKFAPTIQVNPAALAARGIGLDAVANAVTNTTTQKPMGTLQGPAEAYTVNANGQVFDGDQIADTIVGYRNGAAVRLRDVGTVTIGAEQPLLATWVGAKRGIMLAVQRQPGSNVIDLVDGVRKLLPQLHSTIPPSINIQVISDLSTAIRESFQDVQLTLAFTIALVIGVIFMFLRQLWATIIPAVTVPLSIAATFAVMYPVGYSLDNLSLMGLTLAVGLVVDDAVVMLENVVRHLEAGMSSKDAALKGSGEIGFTILSITFSLIAVFTPILLMAGIVGRMFREFAVVITVSVLASAFVSLTLTPMMTSIFLNKPKKEGQRGRFYEWSERIYKRLIKRYEAALTFVLRWRFVTMMATLGLIAATVLLFLSLPTGFFPDEDTGEVFVYTQAAQNISFDGMARLQQTVDKVLMDDPDIASIGSSIGSGGPSTAGNTGRIYVTLKTSHRASAQVIMDRLRPKLSALPGIQTWMQIIQNVRIGGYLTRSEYQYVLQDLDASELYGWAPKLLAKLQTMPGMVDVASDQQLNGASAMLTIDRDRAARLGVDVGTIQQTLYYAFGQRWITQLYAPLNTYHVVFEVGPQFQQDPSALDSIYVKSSRGSMVPLSEVAKVQIQPTALAVNHTGQFPSVTLSFDLAKGASLGQASKLIHQAQQQLHMPETIQAKFQGTAGAFESSLTTQPYLIAGAIFAVYIILGVLYESFVHPATILMSLPPASVGALLALKIFGFDLSIVAVIGLIMLVGIVKKNAIMMIDFALSAMREDGKPAEEAIYQAAVLRFRPIMMTSLAAIIGALPIALGIGAGAELRQPLGVAVVGGLVVSQVLTLFTVPVTFIYFDRFAQWSSRIARRWKPAKDTDHEEGTLKAKS